MIRFDLMCDQAHAFDAWFASGTAFESQQTRGLVVCPECGSTHVDKALMAPAVSTAKKSEKVALAGADAQKKALLVLQEMAREARKSGEYVGEKFAEEARKIHFSEAPERGIYGEASPDEVKGLLDDGIGILPMPVLPEDKN